MSRESTVISFNDNTVNGFVASQDKQYYKKSSITNDLLPTIPPGFYSLAVTPKGELVYKRREMPELPAKIYGSADNDCDRIIRTFFSRKQNTGVLLSGLKGSGKTLQAKLIIHELSKTIPVIVVDDKIDAAYIKAAVDELVLSCVFLDEFEKLYPKTEDRDQVGFLSLLDGTSTGKALFVLTVNDMHVNRNLVNRPGRIFYHKSYEYLPYSFITDYLSDNLVVKDNLTELAGRLFFSDASFDIIQCAVEELNRYPELGMSALQLMNIEDASVRPEFIWTPSPNLKWVCLPERKLSELTWPAYVVIDNVPSKELNNYLDQVYGRDNGVISFSFTQDKKEYGPLGCILTNESGQLCITKSLSKQVKLFDNRVQERQDYWSRPDIIKMNYTERAEALMKKAKKTKKANPLKRAITGSDDE